MFRGLVPATHIPQPTSLPIPSIPIITIFRQILSQSLQFLFKSYHNHYNFSSNPFSINTISCQILSPSLQFLTKSFLNQYNFWSNPISITTISRQILSQSLKFLVKPYLNHNKLLSIVSVYNVHPF